MGLQSAQLSGKEQKPTVLRGFEQNSDLGQDVPEQLPGPTISLSNHDPGRPPRGTFMVMQRRTPRMPTSCEASMPTTMRSGSR